MAASVKITRRFRMCTICQKLTNHLSGMCCDKDRTTIILNTDTNEVENLESMVRKCAYLSLLLSNDKHESVDNIYFYCEIYNEYLYINSASAAVVGARKYKMTNNPYQNILHYKNRTFFNELIHFYTTNISNERNNQI